MTRVKKCGMNQFVVGLAMFLSFTLKKDKLTNQPAKKTNRQAAGFRLLECSKTVANRVIAGPQNTPHGYGLCHKVIKARCVAVVNVITSLGMYHLKMKVIVHIRKSINYQWFFSLIIASYRPYV